MRRAHHTEDRRAARGRYALSCLRHIPRAPSERRDGENVAEPCADNGTRDGMHALRSLAVKTVEDLYITRRDNLRIESASKYFVVCVLIENCQNLSFDNLRTFV
jgi:hypothetical protein